jgi:MFS family permease
VRRSLGREFGWLYTAYTLSTAGTWLAFDAFPLVAILVLHSNTTQVSILSAAGLAVGALVALPLGPWVEFRRKRPVMVAMDLLRFLAMLSVPAAYALGALTFAQLVAVSVIVASANIVFTSASGACLKALVRPEDLLVANGRFEATMWTSTALGPPLGGAAIGIFGPLTTVVVDAASYLLSAFSIRAMGGHEPRPQARQAKHIGMGEIIEAWRYILRHPRLRPLFLNTILVNGLIMATMPLVAILLLQDLGFPPWQYGLAFGVPCVGGLIGSRLARPLVTKFGQHRVMVVSGALRACWSLGLAFIPPGPWGLMLVIAVELGLITCAGVFNPVYATYRLEHTATDRVARTLSAWSITRNASIAALTVCGGLLADVTSIRTALAVAGLLLLATPLLLPRHTVVPGRVKDLSRRS